MPAYFDSSVLLSHLVGDEHSSRAADLWSGELERVSSVLLDIEKVLKTFEHPTIRFDHITTRRSGSRRFVDLHMHMPGNVSLRRAAALRGSVEQALMSAVPGLRATIQLLPLDVEAHFDDEKDLL